MTSITEIKRKSEDEPYTFKIKFYFGIGANGKEKTHSRIWQAPWGIERKEAWERVQSVSDEWENDLFGIKKSVTKEEPEKNKYKFKDFVNEIWVPLFVKDGNHMPATVAMYTSVFDLMLPFFGDIMLDDISGLFIIIFFFSFI